MRPARPWRRLARRSGWPRPTSGAIAGCGLTAWSRRRRSTPCGAAARSANALDPPGRGLVAGVGVATPGGGSPPNVRAGGGLSRGRPARAPRVPATALVIRDGPPQVVTVGPDSAVRYATVTIG